MIHYEEKPHEGMRLSARGKCVWMTITEVKQYAPELVYLFKKQPTEDELLKLKESTISFLGKKGYVFFDKILYRYITDKNGCLKNFSLNHHHIK